MKKILIINGHSDRKSYCEALCDSYVKGANESNIEIKSINIYDLKFDPILHDHHNGQTLEDDLIHVQTLISWCEHLIIVTPMWWGGMPALLKGLIDRTFIGGFSHTYKNGRPIPLLKGRSATVIYTQGAPWLWYFLFNRDAFWKVMKYGILQFCGFGPIDRVYCTNILKNPEKREKFLKKIYNLGKCGL